MRFSLLTVLLAKDLAIKDLIKWYKAKTTSMKATALPTPMKTVPLGFVVLVIKGLPLDDGTSIAGVVKEAVVVVKVGRPGRPADVVVDI